MGDYTGGLAAIVVAISAAAVVVSAIGTCLVPMFKAKKQAKLDEATSTGERLSRAIEHLGVNDADKLHIRIGAIYEFKRLAQDSPRDKESIVEILTAFIKSYTEKYKVTPYQDAKTIINEHGLKDYNILPQDVAAAAHVLSQLVRELIEETAKISKKKNWWRFLEKHNLYNTKGKTKRKILSRILRPFVKNRLSPPQGIYNATETLGNLAKRETFLWSWHDLKASHLNLDCMKVKNIYTVRADLSNTTLQNADFTDAELIYAKLIKADLVMAQLEAVNFFGARLEGARLLGSNLEGASFKMARLEGADFWDAHFDEQTDFTGAVINEHTLFDPGVREKHFPEFDAKQKKKEAGTED